ncbi:MAG: prepilin-type N-terminal cleavage/methylation domain-containing protein [Armatimonadetes bacterium]|nr:prepilin-type N-terminal cleavage/methylation domain-containing protein [Armatimonadota bacterium]
MKTPRRISAFTLTEILTVLAIIGLLLALIVPALFSAKRQAAQKTCLSNIRQIGLAVIAYTQDYDGTFPPVSQATLNTSGISHEKNVSDWYDLLKPYTQSLDLKCPILDIPSFLAQKDSYKGYALNADFSTRIPLASGNYISGAETETFVSLTSLTVAILEARAGTIGLDNTDTGEDADYKGIVKGAVRHSGGANYAFVDGHAKWHRPADFEQVCDGVKPCFSQK